MRWFNYWVWSVALLTAGCTVEEANVPGRDLGADIEEVAATLLEQPLLHSTSIAVVYRGQKFIRHRGDMVTDRPGPPTDATLYEIGSLSKTMAGTLMADAVLQRRLALDDDVRMYLQGDYPNLQYEGEPVRIRHLLSHTSGLPNMLPERANTVLADFTDQRTPRELNAIYARYSKADFFSDLHAVEIHQAPGKDYAYSSTGTELAAHILETVYKSDYESLLRGFFDKSAGMTGVKIKLSEAETPQLALGYHSDNPVPTTPMPQLPWGASGNVKATVPELVKYLEFQLADESAVKESHRPLARFDSEFSIGYFWNIVTGDPVKGTYSRIMAVFLARSATSTSFRNTIWAFSSSPTKVVTEQHMRWRLQSTAWSNVLPHVKVSRVRSCPGHALRIGLTEAVNRRGKPSTAPHRTRSSRLSRERRWIPTGCARRCRPG